MKFLCLFTWIIGTLLHGKLADTDTTATTTTPPTLEAWLVVPAQTAPRSLTEVRGADVTLSATSSIVMERGRETVHEGDEVKGRLYERHLVCNDKN